VPQLDHHHHPKHQKKTKKEKTNKVFSILSGGGGAFFQDFLGLRIFLIAMVMVMLIPTTFFYWEQSCPGLKNLTGGGGGTPGVYPPSPLAPHAKQPYDE
jgi:hypothetical protein